MRIKFTNHIKSLKDMKEEFNNMIDSLPVDLNDCTFSGINFYFNIFDKSTGEKIDLLNDEGETITGFTYGKTKRTERRKKSKITETGKIINFNPNRIAENT